MPLPTSIDDLSVIPGDNFPQGTDAPDVLDNVIREHAAYIAGLRDSQDAVRDDLASTASGKGASLVILSNSMTVQQFAGLPVAAGTGSSKDALALQSALNTAAANGWTLHLLPGAVYECAGVTLDVSCSIVGNGATIKGYLRVTGNDVVLRDLHVIGTNPGIGVYLFGSTTIPTRYYRQKLQNVRITFSPGVATADSFGLYASNIDNLEVSGCNIQYGIQLIGCTDYLIDGNVIDGLYQNNNELIHASRKSWGQIVNNTFKDSLDNYIDLYSSGAKTVVSGNRFLGCKTRLGTAIEIKVTLSDDPNNTSSAANGWAEQIIISGNYFGNTQAAAAQFTSIISVYYLDSRAAPSFTWAETPRNILIHGNVFDGFDATLHGASYFSPIVLDRASAVRVTDNVFRDLALGSSSDMSSCVWIEGCRDVAVTGNRMSMKDGTAVSIHGVCAELTVSGNHMQDDLNKGHILKYGIRITKEGARPDPVVTDSVFTGNIVSCSIGAFRQVYYAAGSMTNCVISGNVFKESSDIQNASFCTITNNKFYVGATRFQALALGNASAVTAHNTVIGNTFESNTTTQKTGLALTRVRGSNISGNICKNATHGFLIAGTSTAGELDYLNIKDNFSVSQVQPNFPTYSAMAAADTALLQSSNNQKIT